MTANKPLITVFDCVDNSRLSNITDAKGEKRGLTPKEQIAVKTSIGSSIELLIGNLIEKVNIKIINVLDGPGALKNIPLKYGDSYIIGGFPDFYKADPELVSAVNDAVYRIVNAHKMFLGMCHGHQALAEAFGGKVVLMGKPIIGAGYIELNNIGLKDSLFSQLNKRHFGSIFWHKGIIQKFPDFDTVLGTNRDGKYQVIKVGDKAWGIQGHPDYTIDGMVGLVKLGSRGIAEGGNNPEDIIYGLKNHGFHNDSSRIVKLFVESVLK